jgi:uncharacterized protein YxjI
MEIDINQKKISFGDKYRIFINGQEEYKASTEHFRLLMVMHLDHYAQGRRLTINKKFAFLKAKYDISIASGQVLEFRTKSWWKKHYQCLHGADLYEIYGHRGRKYSVYKNDRQVAWWDKQAVTWFAGDNYKMVANNKADKELLIAFCLIIDNNSSNDNDRAININLGHLGPQAKKFDRTWLPQ